MVIGWLLWLLTSIAWAHGPCPPMPMLYARGHAGVLDTLSRTCLEAIDPATPEGDRARWLLWHDRFNRDGLTPAVRAALTARLGETRDADEALVAGERLARVDGPAAIEALMTARQLASRWKGPVERADRIGRLTEALAAADPPLGSQEWVRALLWMGVVGEKLNRARAACHARHPASVCDNAKVYMAPMPEAPTADELVPVRNVGSVWAHALWGRAFTTERDALTRALDALPPEAPGRAVARAAVVSALAHGEDEALSIVLRRAWEFLPDDEALLSLAHTVHRDAKDGVGARIWAARLAEIRASTGAPAP